MATVRITKDVLKKLNIFDDTTYPADLKFWVDTRGITSAPWYLSPDDVKYFFMLFSYQEFLLRKKQRELRKITRRPSFFEPLPVLKL